MKSPSLSILYCKYSNNVNKMFVDIMFASSRLKMILRSSSSIVITVIFIMNIIIICSYLKPKSRLFGFAKQ